MRSNASCSFILIAAVVVMTSASAQPPSAVHSFTPGTGQSSGQSPEYFPANVLDYPDTHARRTIPSVDPRHILSLGMGGEIVLRFDAPIVDEVGPDFTVFENAFYGSIGQRELLFAEPARIGVSRDGVTFVDYPFDSLTLAGCAGTIPTNGDKPPTDSRVSGGNSFDLAILGIDSVHFVRVRDITAMIANNPSHPYWDATLSGFDLDAVIGIPAIGRSISSVTMRSTLAPEMLIAPNPATTRVTIAGLRGYHFHIVDQLGRTMPAIILAAGFDRVVVDVTHLSTGAYFVIAEDNDGLRHGVPLHVVRP